MDGEGPPQECSLPLIPAPSGPPRSCPSSAGQTPSQGPQKNRQEPFKPPSRCNAPSLGFPNTNSDLSLVLIGHRRWWLGSLGSETRILRFPFHFISLPPGQAFDFVLPLGKLPESLELPGEAQKLPKGVCSEITQLRNNYCVGLNWECGRRGDGKEPVSPEYPSPTEL